MNWEYSCGAVVFTRAGGQILFVIVQEQAGAYSFPKGHMENSETELETARREVFEETGLNPDFLPGFREVDEYDLAEKPGTRKRVTYFLAEYKDKPLIPRQGEIRRIRLLPYDQALRCFQHEGTRSVLTRALAFLTQQWPMPSPQTNSLIKGFVEQSKSILKDNLVGIYLHGSLVMGCFNPRKSDIDLIIMVDHPLTDSVKRAYMDMAVGCNAAGPGKGIEMSIVLREVCNPFVYPTPFELHFSAGHLKWYTENPDDYIRKMNGTDKDLAAHFTIISKRGKCLYGAPVKDVFAEVPGSCYWDSLWYDIQGAAEEITACTMYLTLNLARVLAYKEDRLVLSKKEGGEWAINHLPSEYHPLIEDALREYSESAEVVYDKALAQSYAGYAIMRIRQGTGSSDTGLAGYPPAGNRETGM